MIAAKIKTNRDKLFIVNDVVIKHSPKIVLLGMVYDQNNI